jgi:hypothetical protein
VEVTAMKKYRPLLIAVGLGLIFVGLVIYRMPDKKDVATPQTELRFSVSKQTVPVGETFTIDIVGDPHGNAVIVAEPHITFDPPVLQLTKIAQSTDYPQVLSTEQISGGSGTITVGSPSLSQPVRTTGIVAHLTFQALKVWDSTEIGFTEQSFIGGKIGSSTPTNILAKRTSIIVSVVN